MKFRLSSLPLWIVASVAGVLPAAGANDATYAAVTARIFAGLGGLEAEFPAIDWSEEIKKARVLSDGSGGFSIERDVEWVLDRPGEPPSKTNGVRPVYKPGGFWIRLTFFRGPWRGAAVFQSVDFGDLHVWFDYGYHDDPSVIRAVGQIIENERAAFERVSPPESDQPKRASALSRKARIAPWSRGSEPVLMRSQFP